MKTRRFSVATYIILGLALIGVASTAVQLIIPILVFGLIFLLLKYPPSKWGKSKSNTRYSKTKEKRSRNANFRVIDGNKGSSDEPPKYH
jgi:fatty acid desaturase